MAWANGCLSLQGNDLGAEGMMLLAPALEKLSGLKNLGCGELVGGVQRCADRSAARSLGRNSLGAHGTSGLALVLEKLPSLEELG